LSWLQVRLNTRAELAQGAEDALLALGAAAVTLEDNADQPLYAREHSEQQLWQQTRVSGLFPANTDLNTLQASLPRALRTGMQAEILEDKDWEREWMQHYEPRQFAENLWLCPSWLEPPEPAATNVLLDPGLAFGTGTHPTTAMCLTELAARTPRGGSVVDFGCGSGVLGIAALLLGAATVLATDIEPQALTATRANAERNHIDAGRLRICHPGELEGDEQADLVLANILAGPLSELAPTLCGMLKPGASLLLSGILHEHVATLRDSYPIALDVAREQDGWVVLHGHADTGSVS
jgi:ribosomal protein L11 methyltransferase